MKTGWLVFGLATLGALGCGESTKQADTGKPSGATSIPLPPPPPAPPATQADDKTIASGDDVEKAQVGVGAKGRGYGGGFITEPIRARFRAEDSINFASMEHTLQLFQAEKGRLPKSHDEFMKEIIEKGGVKLPELPPGDEYIYDPQAGELLVRHTK